MSFTSRKSTAELIPDGEYEVILVDCAIKETTRGGPALSFDFLIRKDVEQECGGRHVYKSFYPDESFSWPDEKIGRYANALGIPDGEDFEPSELVNRKCIAVINSYDRDDGTSKNCIFYLKPTIVSADEEFSMVDNLPDINVSEDEMPF